LAKGVIRQKGNDGREIIGQGWPEPGCRHDVLHAHLVCEPEKRKEALEGAS
jgi:hypothetical protein